jgi:hypothetical protein
MTVLLHWNVFKTELLLNLPRELVIELNCSTATRNAIDLPRVVKFEDYDIPST